MEESFITEKSGQTQNGGTSTTVNAPSGSTMANIPPETLLRRLARSIATRLTYKRCLLENAEQRLEDLNKETELVSIAICSPILLE